MADNPHQTAKKLPAPVLEKLQLACDLYLFVPPYSFEQSYRGTGKERKNFLNADLLAPRFFQQKGDYSKKRYGIAVARLAPAMENNTEPLRLLTLQQTAELLHLSRRTLLRMLRRKDLPAFKVGGQWRIHENTLAKWLEELHEL